MFVSKRMALWSSLTILVFPWILGSILWFWLPNRLAVHFFWLVADGFSSKSQVVYLLPFLFLGLHLLVLYSIGHDGKERTLQLFYLWVWGIPLLSVVYYSFIYIIAFV